MFTVIKHLAEGRRDMVWSGRAVGVLAAAMLAAGCTAAGGGGGAGGDTLVVHTSFVVKSLDPGQVYEATGLTAVHAMYDTLVTLDPDQLGKPKPLLADSFDSSPDATTFTFNLRSDATFADGSPVTAEDVVFSLNRLKNLKASPAVMVGDLTVQAKDEHTVVVTSATPNPNVPVVLAMPATGILNADLARQHGATDAADAASVDSGQKYLDTASVGSGPYVLKTFDSSSQIVLERNPKYWRKAPAFPRVVIGNTDVQNQKLTMSRVSGTDELALDVTGKALDGLPKDLQVSDARDTSYFVYLNGATGAGGRLVGTGRMPVSAATRYPHEFSGGQRQRLAIARALAPAPAVIVADEPVTALDASSQAQVVNLLVRLVREDGMGLLFISHDLSLVRHIADRTAVMYLGTIVESAPTARLWAEPRHPYTRALIDAVPSIAEDARLPAVLAGEVPDPSNVPEGCPFRPRCPLATDECGTEPPVMRTDDASVACWLPAKEEVHHVP